MNKRLKTSELSLHVGEQVLVQGFLHAKRVQGKIAFLRIRDRYGSAQIVILESGGIPISALEQINLESVIEVSGLVKEAPSVPEKIEIEGKSLSLLSSSLPELPIPVVIEKSGGESDITHRLDWRWIDLRQKEKLRIFEVWTLLEKGFREYLISEGFIQLYSPSLMNAPSESGSEVFEVKYFDTRAYLAQSPQFYKQMAMAAGMEKVFMVGPVFRAEPSFTTRHMTEFTGWDFEMSYITSHHDVMDTEEQALISGFNELKRSLLPEITIPQAPFPRLPFIEAKSKLKKAGISSDKPHDLSPEEERAISQIMQEESGSEFLWIIDYPPEGRAFYHMRDENNSGLTKGFDLLYKGLEITTGAQREHRIEVLEKQAKEKGISQESISDYLNFFRYGCPPHGGVGIGPGRIVMQILGLSSVKEATYLPRDVKRLSP